MDTNKPTPPIPQGGKFSKRKLALILIVAAVIGGGYVLWSQGYVVDIARFFASEIPAGAISVRDFGAIGDGATDDAPAIQAAIDSLPLAGGTVYVPAGTYMLGTSAGSEGSKFPNGSLIQTALLITKDNVTFTGDGTTTILKLMPSTKMRMIAVTSDNVIIEKMLFDGNKSQRDGSVEWPGGDVVPNLVFGSKDSHNFEVRFCEVRNGIEDGIGSWNASNTFIHDCFSHDNGTLQAGAVGIAIAGPLSRGGRVINNTVSNSTSANIWLKHSSGVLVQGNIIENGLRNGIAIGSHNLDTTGLSTGHIIVNNIIRGNGLIGISMLSSQDGIIRDNVIIDNGALAIRINDQGTIPSRNILVEGNICSSTALGIQGIGIQILGLSESIILRGNECRDNGTSIAHQIIITNESAVNANWREVNTISYNEPTPADGSVSVTLSTENNFVSPGQEYIVSLNGDFGDFPVTALELYVSVSGGELLDYSPGGDFPELLELRKDQPFSWRITVGVGSGSGGVGPSASIGQLKVRVSEQLQSDLDKFTVSVLPLSRATYAGGEEALGVLESNLVMNVSFPTPPPTPAPIPGDANGDGRVDIFDYNIVVSSFGQAGADLQGDLNGDGRVDIFDYNLVVTNFGN